MRQLSEEKARLFLKFLTLDMTDTENLESTDKSFCHYCIYWLGGSAFNSYLNYDRLARELANYTRNTRLSNEGYKFLREAVDKILWDDRHDLYDNLDWCVEKFIEEHPELEKTFYEFLKEAFLKAIDTTGQSGGDR